MHLLEQYALACGVKINQPQVEPSFFPLPFSDYIIIHPSSGMPAKNYDYFEDVIGLISPYLQEKGIKIVQIGSGKDVPLSNCHHLQGSTTLNQTFFLIKNCMALLGNDSFSTHVASGFNKSIVSLFSNTFKECCGPYWGDSERQVLIQADTRGKKPSFAAREKDKAVNNICCGEIARSLLSLLHIDHEPVNKFKTLHNGVLYGQKAVEVIPDFYSDVRIDGYPPSVNLRLDYHEDPWELHSQLEFLPRWASRGPTHIIIKDSIDKDLFKPFIDNIVKISVKLNPGISRSYISSLQELGCEISLFSESEEWLKPLQVEFLDWGVQLTPKGKKKDLDLHDELCDNTRYKSSKLLLSQGKTYSSKAAWKKNIEKTPNEKIIDSPDFWEDLKYVKIYNM